MSRTRESYRQSPQLGRRQPVRLLVGGPPETRERLADGVDWERYTHYFTPAQGGVTVAGWMHYRVRRYDRAYPPEFCAGHCDILAAIQGWIDFTPELSALLVLEQPLLIGVDFYVLPNRMHPTTLRHFDNLDAVQYPPEVPPELAVMRQRFREAQARFTAPRERLLTSILERELFPPDDWHTWFDDVRFSVMSVATTYAEIDTWLDHEEWWVHPAVEPPPAPPPALAPAR